MAPDACSLAWRTDLIFAGFDGEITDRADHLVVRTPGNPTYWWGNFLLFPRAPGPGDLARWNALFASEITARQPDSRHRAFGVDVRHSVSLPAEFAEAGFRLTETAVLTLTAASRRPPPRRLDEPVDFEVLALPADAPAVVDQQSDVDAGLYEPLSHRLFLARQMARYGAMQDAGLGHWFALRERSAGRGVVASCGLFRDPARQDGLGRFQYVSTHPAWRRRGLCTALVHAVCDHAFGRMGLRTLAMVADPADVAIGVYESLGFERGARAWQIERP